MKLKLLVHMSAHSHTYPFPSQLKIINPALIIQILLLLKPTQRMSAYGRAANLTYNNKVIERWGEGKERS
jgi:hypothetical protein